MHRLHQCGVPLVALMLMANLVACAPSLPSRETAEPPKTDLSAVLEAPATLPSGEAVVLQFTLTNNTDASLYILDWYTPLEGVMGEIFRVTRDGQAIPYEGPLVMRGNPLPDNYVHLETGASVSADVDLATVYDFSQAGEYTIEFVSPRISQVAKAEAAFAASVDGLGPVEIPSNPLALKVAGTSASPVRRTPQVAETIRGHGQGQHPQLDPGDRLSLDELALPEG